MGWNRSAFAGGAALMAAGVVLGWALASRTSGPQPAELGAIPSGDVEAALPARPGASQALRDLLGVDANGALASERGTLTELWTEVDWKDAGGPHHATLFQTHEFDDEGKPENCHMCAPIINAVTYRIVSGQWQLDAKDVDIARIGSWGKAPTFTGPHRVLSLNDVTALAVPERYSGQGYRHEGVSLLGFGGHWRFLGTFPVGGDNKGACDDAEACYEWSGDLKILPSMTNGLPDLRVEAHGTLRDYGTGKLGPAPTLTYTFSGSVYGEKGKPPPKVDPVVRAPVTSPAVRAAQAPAANSEQSVANTVGILTGEVLRYPPGSGKAIINGSGDPPYCTSLREGETVCVVTDDGVKDRILQGLPGGCGGDMSVVFKNGLLESLSCSKLFPSQVAQLETKLRAGFGAPRQDSTQIASMRTDYIEWKAGDDYVLLGRYTGSNIRGEPIDNFDVRIGKDKILPLRR